MTTTLSRIQCGTRGLSIVETIAYLAAFFEGRVAFSTSFGLEDQVLAHLIFTHELDVEVFTLDTGRLFQETYDVFGKTLARYGKPIKTYYPERAELETLLAQQGPNGFYNSVAERKDCCHVRKITPLERALQGKDVWITGLRSGQSANRSKMDAFEYDERFGVLKYNPLINATAEDVEACIAKHRIPQNVLHRQGFSSIGCAPCTRATQPGEDPRAGRWWWEDSHKECGLHYAAAAPVKLEKQL